MSLQERPDRSLQKVWGLIRDVLTTTRTGDHQQGKQKDVTVCCHGVMLGGTFNGVKQCMRNV